MKTRSSKAKGKRLERWIRDTLLKLFPSLTLEDVKITIGVQSGADIKMTKVAQAMIPMKFEAKNHEAFSSIYTHYRQSMSAPETGEPVVIIKMNRQKPLAILDAEYFLNMIKERKYSE